MKILKNINFKSRKNLKDINFFKITFNILMLKIIIKILF